ncbi:MAG: hypothetical protein K6F11_06845 [Lachnospiraceae bacterium]|nr:hypothetical protein [Lachnospiraceae bacterium]
MDYYQLELNREKLLGLLQERKLFFEDLIRDLKRNRPKCPEGTLKVNRCNSSFQYFWRKDKNNPWKYLSKRKKQIQTAEAIVNYDYISLVIKRAEEELKTIHEWISKNPLRSVEEISNEFSEGRKALIHELYCSKEDLVQAFLNEVYEPLQTHAENKQYEIRDGEFVRSKSEYMIAGKLMKKNIPFQYEYPVKLNGYGTARPDFRCLNVRTREIILWEHFGRMGDEEYVKNALQKAHAYEQNGYSCGKNLIITEESAECPLFMSSVDYWIDRMLV